MFKKNTNFGFDINWDKLPDDNLFKKHISFIYNNIDNLNNPNIHVVNGLPIVFKKSEKAISLNFSGGADSTMLFYLLCRIIESTGAKTKICVSTLVRFWEDRSWTEHNAREIFDYIDAMFPSIEKELYIGFIPPALEMTPLKNLNLGETIFDEWVIENANAGVYAVQSFNDYICHMNGAKHQYSGTTMNPEEEISKAPEFRRMRELKKEELWQWFDNYDGPVRDPFLLINKDWVMAQYENFNLQKLRDLTRSCEANKLGMDTKFGPGKWHARGSEHVCGECFFCKERDWAQTNCEMYLEEFHK
jgi:hypothetical protein